MNGPRLLIALLVAKALIRTSFADSQRGGCLREHLERILDACGPGGPQAIADSFARCADAGDADRVRFGPPAASPRRLRVPQARFESLAAEACALRAGDARSPSALAGLGAILALALAIGAAIAGIADRAPSTHRRLDRIESRLSEVREIIVAEAGDPYGAVRTPEALRNLESNVAEIAGAILGREGAGRAPLSPEGQRPPRWSASSGTPADQRRASEDP